MQYHKQLFQHEPEKGIYGDCYRTCIACLLDLSPKEVPHFLFDNTADGKVFDRRTKDFLASKGLTNFTIAMDTSLEDLLSTMEHLNPEIYYLLTGYSDRGVNHVVICKGGEIIHDPSNVGYGLTGPAQPNGYYWIEVLTKI